MSDYLPQIRIKDAWLLRQNASVHLNELWGEGEALRSNDEYFEIAQNYKKAWQPYELKILTGLTKTLGLTFNQNIIDVYIAPWFGAFSDPMVIGVVSEPDRFIDLLTHELIHRLLTDNTSSDPEKLLIPTWENLFGQQHSFNTLIHIPVHAVHRAIYLDVLQQPERLERDMHDCIENNSEDYIKAWEYVNQQDHKQLIEKLKGSYNS